MKRKLKRTIAALSAIAMLGTTATVLPEGMSFDFGTGITASAAGTEQQSTDEATVYQPAVETTDKYDIDDGSAKVYQIEKYSKCDKSDTPVTAYSNTDKTQVAEHIIENGFCVNCDYLQPAVETTDKYDIDDDSMKENVYEISNAGQLYWFAGLVNGTLDGVEQNTLANAILTANITVNENLLDSLQYDEENNVSNGSDFISWTPIADWMGNRTTQYSGTFDGNNKTVSGLYFNGDSTCIGLFGSSESDGNIKNVGVVDSYFKGNDSVGGVCGKNAGTITNCYNAGNLTAIESSAHIGGICGYNNSGTIANCYNTGTVTATGQVFSVGGVCGCSTAPISNCYNIGTVTATDLDTNISGICGYYFGSIKNCYYLANTEDENGGKTADQFASGEVAYLLNGDQFDIHFYQTIGDDAFPTFDNTHGVVYSYAGCTDKTYYTNTETADIPHDFDENGFCKKNSTHYQPATLNSETGNYEIENAGQLYWFAAKVNAGEKSANAILTADIVVNEGDLSGYDGISENSWRKWTPINSYSGTFDGQNHKISGLYFNDDNEVFIGLFGITEGATIKKVGVVNSYFEGSENVGGICGVGFGGTISECYSTATVIGINVAGGICGIFDSLNVINCFNSGKISAGSEVGGICGSIRNSSVENCYYDKTVFTGDAIGNTSDTNTIEKVEGKTTEQFASGEVAMLLGDAFGQTIGTDEIPVLGGQKVYKVEKTGCGVTDTEEVYSNTNENIVVEHSFENGICTKCGTKEEAKQNSNGYYEISNAGQLYWFAGLVNGTLDGVKQNTLANAILTANITVNENLLDSLQYDAKNNVSNGSDFISWTPIADCMGNNITGYSGTFDGNNKTVSGLYFNGNSTRIGLFGSSEADGNIKNVGVVDSYFKGNDFVGGVCGRNDGTITNCYNAGNLTAIESSAAIGGICGYNNGGTVTNCYNAGNLTAIESSAAIGGICGYNNGGTVTNCYNTGTVTATGQVSSVGGVCGCSNAPISNCYNIGTVTATDSDTDISGICGYNFGPIKNCYYLADTEDENGGKTTAQFSSGEVAYLLSQGCTVGEGEDAVTYSGSVWSQNLATENYPVLNGKTVYQVDSYEGCIGNPGNSTKVYSNTGAPIYAEHDYSSKEVCTICGAFKNGIGEHLDGYSLSLDGNIGVNFFMELDKSVIADENAYMKFRLPNGKTSVVLVGDAKQQTVGGTTYYVFSCEVAAKEMNETITAQIITSDKKGEIYEYSVADYIQYIRDNPTEFDEKTLSLVNAMAGYGDYAKAYFNNENLDANTEMDAVTADTLASFDKQISGDLPEGIIYYGSSLLLESNTTMRHYFKVAEGTDVSALSFSGSKGNYYYIDIPNISAEKLGTIQNVTIGNCTISYSPMSYAYAVLSSKNTSESLKNLVKSLYLYEQVAEAYKN